MWIALSSNTGRGIRPEVANPRERRVYSTARSLPLRDGGDARMRFGELAAALWVGASAATRVSGESMLGELGSESRRAEGDCVRGELGSPEAASVSRNSTHSRENDCRVHVRETGAERGARRTHLGFVCLFELGRSAPGGRCAREERAAGEDRGASALEPCPLLLGIGPRQDGCQEPEHFEPLCVGSRCCKKG
jgi:hypothetical protein